MSSEEPPRTSHDRIFKEFLHRFLPEFLELFFPDKAAQLDFSTLKFLDKELIINLPGQTLRITDVVAEVQTQAGQAETIIVHVEIEASHIASLPFRMFEYYALLRILRQKPVLPLTLVLLPGVGGLTEQVYTEQLFGEELVSFRYGQVGIRDLPGEDYLKGGNPIAAALSVLMKSAETNKAIIKLVGLQTILTSDLTDGDKLFLMSLVERYLPKEQLLIVGGETMETLDKMELLWHEKIELKGELKGKRDVLLRLLSAKFGELPKSLVVQINAISESSALDDLSEQVLTAETLNDFILPESVAEE